jgi:hypothetical protein
MEPIDVNAQSDISALTTLQSGDTPDDPFDDAPDISALKTAKDAAIYKELLARIPKKNKHRYMNLEYVRIDPYRTKPSKASAWYWNPKLAEELICVTKSTYFPDMKI